MEPTQPNSGAPGAAAAAAVGPDAVTAEILRKHAAGEPLSPQESGKLGWWKKTLNRVTGAAAQSADAAAAPGKPAAVAAVEQNKTPGNSLESVEIDDTVCQRTAAAILGRANTATVGWIEREASATVETLRLNEAQRDKMLARFRGAASLPPADQKLIVDLSPDVCRELGLNPRQFAVYTVGGVQALHSFNLWQCVQELKDLRRTVPQAEAKEEKPAAPASAIVGPPAQ
jgi:hypothetical protein